MAGYNLPDNVSASDPRAPWNAVNRPTRARVTVHYGGQTATFETEWDYCPTEEEVALDFGENYHVTIDIPDDDF